MAGILKNMVEKAWGIIILGNTAWDKIGAEKASASAIRRQYVYPWIITAIVVTFLFGLLYTSDKALETAILDVIITTISLLGAYFISNLMCFAYLKKASPELASKVNCETIIAYSYTVIILIDIATVIIPSLFFLRILSIFVAYVIWEGCRAIWLLKEDERGNIVLVFSIVIIFIPIIISKIIHWMLPNA